MAEETPEAAPKKSGGGIVKIAIAAVLVLVAAGAGFATYLLVLAPKLGDDEAMAEVEEPTEYIPLAPVAVDLDENFVNVIMEDPTLPASTLMYGVTLECNNQMTADIIMANIARFSDMVSKLHDSRLRKELDDMKSLKTSIQAEIRQKSNALLNKLVGEPNDEIMVTNVYHRTMVVDDGF